MQISVEEPQRRTWDRRDEYRDDVAPPATAWSDKLRGDTIPEGCNRRSARSRGSSVQQHLSTSSAPRFKIKDFHSHKIDKASSDPLLPIKARLAAGEPLVYGSREPNPWKPDDTSSPWEKFQDIKMDGDKPAGHVMLIIGYDDDMRSSAGKGAILLQNSWGPRWGISWERAFGGGYKKPTHSGRGFVWITYEAFLALAQGTVFTVQV